MKFGDIIDFADLAIKEEFVFVEDEPFELVHRRISVSMTGNNSMCCTTGNYKKIADDAKVKRWIGD